MLMCHLSLCCRTSSLIFCLTLQYTHSNIKKTKQFLFMKIKQKRNNNWFKIDLVSATYTRTCTVKLVEYRHLRESEHMTFMSSCTSSNLYTLFIKWRKMKLSFIDSDLLNTGLTVFINVLISIYVSPRGYHPPCSQCFGTDMVY